MLISYSPRTRAAVPTGLKRSTTHDRCFQGQEHPLSNALLISSFLPCFICATGPRVIYAICNRSGIIYSAIHDSIRGHFEGWKELYSASNLVEQINTNIRLTIHYNELLCRKALTDEFIHVMVSKRNSSSDTLQQASPNVCRTHMHWSNELCS